MTFVMIFLREGPGKSRKFGLFADAERDALRDIRPVAVERPEAIDTGLEIGGQPEANSAIGRWRGDPHDRLGQGVPAVVVDQHDFSADHEIAVRRANNPVLKFDERND